LNQWKTKADQRLSLVSKSLPILLLQFLDTYNTVGYKINASY